jgi:polyisoprenoid-binding protein YceI
MLRTSLALLLASVLAAPAKEYRAIKGESTLSYVLVHPMKTVIGVNKDFDCTVDLSSDTVSSVIRVSADVLKFDSGNSSRDSHAMEAVHSRKYPKVVFASGSIKPEGDGYAVAGNLTFHGQTRPVAFHVTPKISGDRIKISGTFDVKLSDFKVERPSLMFVPAKDKLTLRFDLSALP